MPDAERLNEAPPPWAGGPYSVKRHGVSISNCDSEPVQTPGCIQDHGALIVLRRGDLAILQVSENIADFLGRPAGELLGRPAAEAIGPAAASRLADFLAREPTDRNPLYVLTLDPRDGRAPLDLSAHTIDGIVVAELEATGRSGDEPDYYGLLKKTVARLQAAATVRQFCDIVTEEVRGLTGLDRAMVYKFHEDGHGEVIAESRRDDLPSWLGLHYPAEDIPGPARAIFRKIWVRPLPDAEGGLAELVPLANPDTGRPLDMTYCALRGASVMYTEYLRNMGVRASLTMPVRHGEVLWGLIACHHYDGPKHVGYQARAVCEFLAQVVSLQLKSAEDREHLAYRLRIEGIHNQLVAQAAHEGGLSAMTDGRPALLDGLSAGGAALYHRERWWRVGSTPGEAELDALAVWLGTRPEFDSPDRPLYATDCLARDYPVGEAIAPVASGVLAFPLSRALRNLMIWFRPETIRAVNWAGNPHDKPTVPGPHGPRLTPRGSFELFRESVRNRSLPWRPVELDAAARLRLLIMELVVGRAERLAELNADLAQSNEELDAFAYVASHDLKEPLRGIHKYAHQVLEDAASLDAARREKLEGLMRLTVRMDSLLESLLHFSRSRPPGADARGDRPGRRGGGGRGDRRHPARRPARRGTRRAAAVAVGPLRSGPGPRDLRQPAFERPQVQRPSGEACRGRFPGAAGTGPAPGLSRGGRGAGDLLREGRRHRHRPEALRPGVPDLQAAARHGEYGGGTGAGLTIVKKLVERHHGQIWIDSAPGAGATFYFTLSGEEGNP